MTDYPSDRKGCGYAVRYLRWLCDSGTALEVGPDAVAVLVAVVTLEDELHYTRTPNFFNDQLQRRAGIGSLPALIRARTRAVEAGLLHYEASTKRYPGRYFVVGFPNDSLWKAEGKRKESEMNCAPSIPINPIPNIDIAKPKKTNTKKFVPPTLEEVSAYCRGRNNTIAPQKFIDYYEANGWMQGKTPIKNWQAAVRTWETNSYSKAPPKQAVEYPEFKPRPKAELTAGAIP